MREEDSKKVAMLKTDLNAYMDEKLASWLTNKTSIDAEWDQVQKDLDRYCIKELVGIYKKYQDAYYAAMRKYGAEEWGACPFGRPRAAQHLHTCPAGRPPPIIRCQMSRSITMNPK
jgi:hypothetical protein